MSVNRNVTVPEGRITSRQYVITPTPTPPVHHQQGEFGIGHCSAVARAHKGARMKHAGLCRGSDPGKVGDVLGSRQSTSWLATRTDSSPASGSDSKMNVTSVKSPSSDRQDHQRKLGEDRLRSSSRATPSRRDGLVRGHHVALVLSWRRDHRGPARTPSRRVRTRAKGRTWRRDPDHGRGASRGPNGACRSKTLAAMGRHRRPVHRPIRPGLAARPGPHRSIRIEPVGAQR